MTTLNVNSSFVKIAVLMALLGTGGAIFQSPNNSSIMGSVPREQLGIAGGINALFRNLRNGIRNNSFSLTFHFYNKNEYE